LERYSERRYTKVGKERLDTDSREATMEADRRMKKASSYDKPPQLKCQLIIIIHSAC
jgi:hypothetical protein